MRPSILIVEDDPDLRRGLSLRLQLDGYLVHEAADGPSAVTQVERQRPDLVLLDLGIPGLDGLGVLAELRTERGLQVPVVVLSGRDVPTARQAAFSAGADAFLSKPVEGADLRATLDTLVPREPAH